jgi:hypothetical protein
MAPRGVAANAKAAAQANAMARNVAKEERLAVRAAAPLRPSRTG